MEGTKEAGGKGYGRSIVRMIGQKNETGFSNGFPIFLYKNYISFLFIPFVTSPRFFQLHFLILRPQQHLPFPREETAYSSRARREKSSSSGIEKKGGILLPIRSALLPLP